MYTADVELGVERPEKKTFKSVNKMFRRFAPD
jgi:hypothetical protein